jgi:anti-sigma factor RsiW
MNAPFDETDFNAWLDGELTPERRAAIEAWLHDHPLDAAQVRLWAADREALRSQLDGVLSEPVPARLTRLVTHGSSSIDWRRWQAWAAALALFLLGGVAGGALVWQGRVGMPPMAAAPTLPNAWVQRAALAHRVYVPEVRHAVEVKAQEEHLSRWLTRRLDVPVKLFDLRDQGFELVGGRLLPDAAGPGAQLMYQAIVPVGGDAVISAVGGAATNAANGSANSAGGSTASNAASSPAAPPRPARVTVYLRKPDAHTPAAFRYEQQGPLGMFYWVEGDSPHGAATGYALVGELPRERLLALAEAIHRQGVAPP